MSLEPGDNARAGLCTNEHGLSLLQNLYNIRRGRNQDKSGLVSKDNMGSFFLDAGDCLTYDSGSNQEPALEGRIESVERQEVAV
jgi:hypothetical protein